MDKVNRAFYRLSCSFCGLQFEDDGFRLTCPEPHSPALLTTRYSSRTLEVQPHEAGIYRYQCWLPNTHRLPHTARTVTYQSKRLSSLLRLPNLWIAFSGFWPERGARLETATFKELEVGGVLSRIPPQSFLALVIASAGNTAAAFARSCSENEIPCLIVIPANGMKRMKFANRLKPCVKIVCLTGKAVYSDAIAFAESISQADGFMSEGGVRNSGRRDGMATAMLNAAETIGRLPDYYFQAIGSGAGAIAAHEAAKRLVDDSRFGAVLPRLMLSQNLPFTPIYDAWKNGCAEVAQMSADESRSLIEKIKATVLSNTRPPFSVSGGMLDVLRESNGEMFAVPNEEVIAAMNLFDQSEGIDIDPAAGVALASLIRAAGSGQVSPDATILLHITGGGARRRETANNLIPASPDAEFSLAELASGAAVERTRRLFTKQKVRAAAGMRS